MLKKLLVGMIVASAIAASGPAEAGTVKYYTRAALAFPTISYTAAYGPMGSCTDGVQTAPITSCTSSTGQVVANSKCSPQAQTQSCGAHCASLVQYEMADLNGTYITATTVAAANAACASFASKDGPGACTWDTSDYNVVYSTGQNAVVYPFPSVSKWWATSCN